VVEKKYWGGVCLSVGCVPSKALLRNAELAHLVNGEAKPLASTSMAPSVSTIRFDHVAAFRRSRKVADGRVRGVHFLMKKNDITELTGHGTFLDPRTLRVDLTGGGTETVTFANAIVAAGATIRLGPGHRLLPELTLAQQWDLGVNELGVNELGVNEIARNVHAHPTLGEAVKEAIHGLAGHMINL